MCHCFLLYTNHNITEKSTLHKHLSTNTWDLQWDYTKAPVSPTIFCLKESVSLHSVKKTECKDFCAAAVGRKLSPHIFFRWPGGGQTLHNICVKHPYYNAHISIITIIIVMG